MINRGVENVMGREGHLAGELDTGLRDARGRRRVLRGHQSHDRHPPRRRGGPEEKGE